VPFAFNLLRANDRISTSSQSSQQQYQQKDNSIRCDERQRLAQDSVNEPETHADAEHDQHTKGKSLARFLAISRPYLREVCVVTNPAINPTIVVTSVIEKPSLSSARSWAPILFLTNDQKHAVATETTGRPTETSSLSEAGVTVPPSAKSRRRRCPNQAFR
jgi:hypothetical protein